MKYKCWHWYANWKSARRNCNSFCKKEIEKNRSFGIKMWNRAEHQKYLIYCNKIRFGLARIFEFFRMNLALPLLLLLLLLPKLHIRLNYKLVLFSSLSIPLSASFAFAFFIQFFCSLGSSLLIANFVDGHLLSYILHTIRCLWSVLYSNNKKKKNSLTKEGEKAKCIFCSL